MALPGFDQNGNPVFIPEESVDAALQMGFRLETPEEEAQRLAEEKFGDQPVRTALEGVARGATFGLSDPFLKGAGVPVEEMAGRKLANPTAATVGEVGGGVAGSALPVGPVGAVAKAGSVIERGVAASLGKGILSKAVAKSAGGAAEGLAAGLGAGISEQTLENVPLSAEKLAASGFMGMVLGGAGGGLLSLGGSGLSSGARLLKEDLLPAGASLSGKLDDFAKERALKASGFIQKDLKKLRAEKQDDIADFLLESGVMKAGDKVDDIQARAVSMLQEEGAKIGAVYKEADRLTGGGAFDFQKVTDRIQKEVVDGANPTERAMLANVRKMLREYRKEAEKGAASFEFAHAARADLDDTINWAMDAKLAGKLSQKMRGIFDDELKRQIDLVEMQAVKKSTLVDALEAANNRYGKLASIAKTSTEGVNRAVGNRSPLAFSDQLWGMSGLGAGAILGGGVVPALGLSAAASIANKIARERGNAAVAISLHKLLKSGRVDAVLKALDGGLDKLTKGAIDDAMQTGRKALTPPAVSLVDELFGPTKMADGGKPKDRSEALAAKGETLSKLAANPELLAASIRENMGGAADASPQLADALAVQATAALNHLQAVIPKPPAGNVIPALGQKWRPSDAEVSRFERHYRATVDPLSVFADLRKGSITAEAIASLQAVYPQLTEKLRTSVLERLAARTDPLPYAAQNAVKSFLGNTHGAAKVAQLQSVFSQQDVAQPQRPTQGPNPLSVASGSMTAAQRLAGRRG
jgi:hypothetical protein